MAGPIFPSPLRAALLSTALIALLGACAAERDAAEAPPITDQAGSATAPAQPVDDAMSATPGADATVPAAICNADGVQNLVGQEATETLTAQATADSGATSVRVLGPNDAATMDFRGDRLNVLTDDAGVIQSLSCG